MAALSANSFRILSFYYINIYFRNSYRCGVFYAGDEPGDVPRFTVFVLPKRFEMDCAKDPEEQKAEAKKECTELVSHLEFGLYVLHLI